VRNLITKFQIERCEQAALSIWKDWDYDESRALRDAVSPSPIDEESDGDGNANNDMPEDASGVGSMQACETRLM
jgi:hypothetical protein